MLLNGARNPWKKASNCPHGGCQDDKVGFADSRNQGRLSAMNRLTAKSLAKYAGFVNADDHDAGELLPDGQAERPADEANANDGDGAE